MTSATLGTGSALKAGLRSVPIVGIAIVGEAATLRTQDRLKIVGHVLTTLAAIGAELLQQERGNGDGILATAVGELFGKRTEPLGQRVLKRRNQRGKQSLFALGQHGGASGYGKRCQGAWVKRSIIRRRPRCCGVISIRASPLRPARPVRPMRWT